MIEIVTVTNPVYANTDNSVVDCEVVLREGGIDMPSMPYSASAQDIEPYGIALWNGLIAGDYGDISPYSDPIIGYKDNIDVMSQVDIAAAKKIEALEKSKYILTQPVTVNGEGFWVDKNSVNDMSGIVTEKMSNGLYYVDWFFQGVPRRYTVQEFQPLHNAVKGYQQKIFSQLAEIIREIDTYLVDGTDVSLIDVEVGVGDGWASDVITL